MIKWLKGLHLHRYYPETILSNPGTHIFTINVCWCDKVRGYVKTETIKEWEERKRRER